MVGGEAPVAAITLRLSNRGLRLFQAVTELRPRVLAPLLRRPLFVSGEEPLRFLEKRGDVQVLGAFFDALATLGAVGGSRVLGCVAAEPLACGVLGPVDLVHVQRLHHLGNVDSHRAPLAVAALGAEPLFEFLEALEVSFDVGTFGG